MGGHCLQSTPPKLAEWNVNLTLLGFPLPPPRISWFRPASVLLEVGNLGKVRKSKLLSSENGLADCICLVGGGYHHGDLVFDCHDKFDQIKAVTMKIFDQSTGGADFVSRNIQFVGGDVTDLLLDGRERSVSDLNHFLLHQWARGDSFI